MQSETQVRLPPSPPHINPGDSGHLGFLLSGGPFLRKVALCTTATR